MSLTGWYDAWHPGKLWSLYDLMMQYGVGDLIDLQSFLASLCTFADDGQPNRILRFHDEQYRLTLERLRKYLELLNRLDLPVRAGATSSAITCMEKAERANASFLIKGQNLADFRSNLDILVNIAGKEMKGKSFIFIQANKARLLETESSAFGDEVESKLPNTAEDISEASKCLALGRTTACVFHLMRAMEATVQVLSGKLEITNTDREWGKLLSDMKHKIEAMPLGPERNKWSESHSLLYHVKQAWRNSTMHPKQTYTDEEAEAVYRAVESFMKNLSRLV